MSENELIELEAHFKSMELPRTLQLSAGVKIINLESSIHTAFQIIRGNTNSPNVSGPRIVDLLQIKALITA